MTGSAGQEKLSLCVRDLSICSSRKRTRVQAEEREKEKTQNGLDISLGHIHLELKKNFKAQIRNE